MENKVFSFGKNWKAFLSSVDEDRIAEAENSLKSMLELEDLSGKRFLDIGSGSGLFSLAARNLGAEVYSFDSDSESVWCTKELKERFRKNDSSWIIDHGSILDKEYLSSLNAFDIVYSWGVLHHTGDMWQSLENISRLLMNDSYLYIALYNYQPVASGYWSFVKRTYNQYRTLRIFWIILHSIYPLIPSILIARILGRKRPRGMNYWHDLLDWLGGYPFEVATPKQIFEFFRSKELVLTKLETVGGRLGCNEYVFRKSRR